MIRAGARAAVVAGAAALLAAPPAPASARPADGDDDEPAAPAGDPAPAAPAATPGGDRVAALAGDGLDRPLLVGPSGQVYEPDGGGRWVRRAPGGVAADVGGAALAGGALVVIGRATPLYRRDGSVWYPLRIGENGRTVAGAGPAAAVAVNRHVFVHTAGAWKRVGTLPARATLLWASGPTGVWAATDAGLYQLKGKAFTKAGAATPDALVGLGKTPWAIAADGLRNLANGRVIPAKLAGADVTIAAAASAPGDAALHVVADTGAGLALARVDGAALVRVDDVPVTGRVAALRVDGRGDALVVLADGTIARRRGGTWTTGAVEDDLPGARGGAGPARSR